MILSILEHTPIWVWILFCALIALGIAQIRTREVSVARATVLPLVMIALSLSGVLTGFSQAVPLAVGSWVVGFWISLTLVAKAMAVRGASWSSEAGRIRVPGTFVPLGLILGLFLIKYAVGAMLAINPPLRTDLRAVIGLSLLYGAFASLFWARARSLRSLVRGTGSGTGTGELPA